FGKPVTDLSPGALDALERYHWPGNVRELENIVARSVALTGEPTVQLDQIPLDVALAPVEATGEDQLNLREARHEVERLLILRALDRAGGNQTVAARLLGMDRNTLLVKHAQRGLRAPEPGGAKYASSSAQTPHRRTPSITPRQAGAWPSTWPTSSTITSRERSGTAAASRRLSVNGIARSCRP